MSKSGKQKTIDGLILCGWERDPMAKTSKYLVFTRNGQKLLVGRSGALRQTKGSISSSTSLTGTRTHKAFQRVGENSTAYTSTEQAREHFRAIMTGKELPQ